MSCSLCRDSQEVDEVACPRCTAQDRDVVAFLISFTIALFVACLIGLYKYLPRQ
jgi:uncharacterized paraquat-inducible protein A